MVNFIRRYKGVNSIPEASGEKTVDIYGGFGQWANVQPEYNSYPGNTGDRSCYGYFEAGTNKRYNYKDESGRNDIYDAKVARDGEYVYFMVRCKKGTLPQKMLPIIPDERPKKEKKK